MPPIGFIQDDLDLKLLVLYIMDRAAGPITFLQLFELALCDAGVDYFSLAQAVDHMITTGQLTKEGERYAITDKGRRVCAAGESSLSPIIRRRCDQRLAPLNQALKRKAQVRAQVEERPQGFDVRLFMDDDQGSLFSLTLLSPTREDAQGIADRFLAHPDRIYNGLLGALLADDDGREHR